MAWKRGLIASLLLHCILASPTKLQSDKTTIYQTFVTEIYQDISTDVVSGPTEHSLLISSDSQSIHPDILSRKSELKASLLSVNLKPAGMKRSQRMLGFVTYGGSISTTCNSTTQYTLQDNGQLIATINGVENYFSVNTGTSFQAFQPMNPAGDITTYFSVTDARYLTWTNPAFNQGQAEFCVTNDGTIYAVFLNNAGPAGCTFVTINIISASTCAGAGPSGPSGPSGPQGSSGPSGPQGIQGSAGPSGLQGPAGASGAQGLQGNQGSQGAQGLMGLQGSAGPSGPQGPAGASGAQGLQGSQGPQGVSGAAGAVATGKSYGFLGCFPQSFVYPGLGPGNYSSPNVTTTSTYTTTVAQPTSITSFSTQTVTTTTTATTASGLLNQAGVCLAALGCTIYTSTITATRTSTATIVSISTNYATSTVTTTVNQQGIVVATAGALGTLYQPSGFATRIQPSYTIPYPSPLPSSYVPVVQQCSSFCGASSPQSNYFGTQTNVTTGVVDCYCGDTLFYVSGIPATLITGQLLDSNCEYCPDKRGDCGKVDNYAIAIYANSF